MTKEPAGENAAHRSAGKAARRTAWRNGTGAAPQVFGELAHTGANTGAYTRANTRANTGAMLVLSLFMPDCILL